MASVAFRNIHKSFGPVRVIDDVSFDIADGEFMVLVGPSGCGKSTLLRILAGLEETSAGTVSIGDRVVNDIDPKNRDIAMVFQSYALYPHMTVAENMGFALTMQKVDARTIGERVANASRILDLDPCLARYPRELSGGQRQRVAMGRAIVRDPKVFLFDEPLSNLDAKLRVAMRGEIKALHRRLATTTVYVTHDQVEAMTMADRIAVMDRGRIAQIGAPLELYQRPDNLFVAQFIGSPSMNVVHGRVHQQHGASSVRDDNGTHWPLPGWPGLDGRAVSYGVRPEHLRVARDEESGIAADVVVVEPTGPVTEVVLRSGTTQVVLVTPGTPSVAPGERLRLVVDRAAIHLFDRDTGLRITG